MNYFYTDPDPAISVTHLDDKRLVKMVLETAQILSTAAHLNNFPVTYKPTHKGHPCTVWAAESYANYRNLLDYFQHICREYQHRYNRVHKSSLLLSEFVDALPSLPSLPGSNPPQVTPGVTATQLCLAYQNYLCNKWRNDNNPKWTNRPVPDFFKPTKEKAHESRIKTNS